MLAGERRQQAGEQVEELARKTQQLAEEQKNFEQRMRQALGSMMQDEQGGQQGRPSLLQQPGTSRRQTEPLQTEEKKLIEELTQIQKDMQKAARDMAASQPSVSNKLRDALGEAQKQDLGMKMGVSVEVMRRQRGEETYALIQQPAITQGLNQLRDQVREAQSALNRDQAGGNDLEAALGRAERLRNNSNNSNARDASRASKANNRGNSNLASNPAGNNHRQPELLTEPSPEANLPKPPRAAAALTHRPLPDRV